MRISPYALAIRSIKYAMLCTRSIVYPTLILAREYNSDLGVDHWTTVKIILSGIRVYFSIMEVTKRSVVKGYVDASFDTNPDDSKSQSGYILKVGAISYSSSVQSIVDIEICKIHTDLNFGRPVD